MNDRGRREYINLGDSFAYDSDKRKVDPKYAYMLKEELHITRHGYAQIVGGWLDFSGLTRRQMNKVRTISEHLNRTGYLYVSSRRKCYDVYAYPIDCEGREPDVSILDKYDKEPDDFMYEM